MFLSANNFRLGGASLLKKLVILVVGLLFVVATIVLAILYGLERKKTSAFNDDLCLTPYCVKAANYLLESIDETVEPCEDFYQFTCGKWLMTTKIPDDAGSYFTFDEMQSKVDSNIIDLLSLPLSNGINESKAIIKSRQLYVSCIDENTIEAEGVHALLSLVNMEFGGWPILQGSASNNATFNISELLIQMDKYASNTLYTLGSVNDDQNSSAYILQIGQGSLGLGIRNYYVNESNITIAYRQFIKNMVLALTNVTSVINNTIDKDVEDIFKFEQTIAQYHRTLVEQLSEQSIRTKVINVSAIINTTFDFTGYLRRAYELGNVTLNDTDIVNVNEPDFLHNVPMIIDGSSSRTVQNYVIWRFMMNQAKNMPQQFRAIKLQFDQVFEGVISEQKRTFACVTTVNNVMGMALSKLYADKYLNESASNEPFEMIGNIRNIFMAMVHQSTWLDADSRNEVIEKTKAMTDNIGYPDYLLNDTMNALESEYAEYSFNLSYITNILTILQINGRNNFRMLREPVDRTTWSFPSTVATTDYTPAYNRLLFPAGILQTPFFHKDAPKYLNYGAIGVLMGHEIIHGFAIIGRQYNKEGNKGVWWTNQSIAAFENRTKCMIQQYNNYILTAIDRQVDGILTEDENIADNGGIKQSFFAYQKWASTSGIVEKKLPGLVKYSAEQLFFINYGRGRCSQMRNSYAKNFLLTDVRAPSQFRVNGPTSNLVEFDRVFGCHPGQGNSRVNKCSVW